MCITKSKISMRTWRSPMSATSQGAFVVIPEISHSDISGISTKAPCEAALIGERHVRIEISDFVIRTFVLMTFYRKTSLISMSIPIFCASARFYVMWSNKFNNIFDYGV